MVGRFSFYIFLRSTEDLLAFVFILSFEKNVKLYSCDFESLYTNICLTHALSVLTQFISNNFHSNDVSSTAFHEILKLIFENNVFSFNKKFYISNQSFNKKKFDTLP